MKILAHIPNGLTCLNLLCGYIGIIAALEGNLKISSTLIFLAALFDFFDGFAARILKAHSKIGKDLDSLADMITFGVLPGIIVFKLSTLTFQKIDSDELWITYLSAIIPIFSALRLAKFNVDIRQANSFLGLPTPANAMFIASLPYVVSKNYFIQASHVFTALFPLVVGVLMSFLLISEMPLMALKFKDFTWGHNKTKYALIVLSTFIFIFVNIPGIPIIIFLYMIFSWIEHKWNKKSSTYSEKHR